MGSVSATLLFFSSFNLVSYLCFQACFALGVGGTGGEGGDSTIYIWKNVYQIDKVGGGCVGIKNLRFDATMHMLYSSITHKLQCPVINTVFQGVWGLVGNVIEFPNTVAIPHFLTIRYYFHSHFRYCNFSKGERLG